MADPGTPLEQQEWMDASRPEEDRVEALLANMSTEEKRRQLGGFLFFDTYWQKQSSTNEDERIRYIESVTPDSIVPPEGLGTSASHLRDLPPGAGARVANTFQRYIRENTRLGIPLLIHDEGLHGLIGNGSTVFPQALGMAASWNPELLGQVAVAIGREARAKGIRQLLSPTVNLVQDARAGRTEESYGEDPSLASAFAKAYIRGVQSHGVACTPKHFVANFVGDGGRDSYAINFSERELRERYFPAFRSSIAEAKAMSLMAAYNSVDGRPCSASHFLLTDILRSEWGFDGFVVSDYHSVVHMYELHRTASTKADAAVQALRAGMDVELPRYDCFGDPLKEALESGEAEPAIMDDAVRRVLRIKFRLGLFDNPYVDEVAAAQVTNCPEHRALAREMARQSIVLLRNEKATLPFGADLDSIAVIGPNADAIQLGDYSWDLYTKERIRTVLAGIKDLAGGKATVRHARGCALTGDDRSGFAGAVSLAKECGAVVLVVGSSHKITAEAKDRAELRLPGLQEELISEVAAAAVGKPVAVVLVTGSVHTMGTWHDEVGAIVQAWYPGEQGGDAVAEVLFGSVNPAGRLPLSWPRHVGQYPMQYGPKPSGRNHHHSDLPEGPLYPFGHGLSYTRFEYANLYAEARGSGEGRRVTVHLEVHNSGDRTGEEVVQVYIRHPVCPVTAPVRKLVAFRRVLVPAGETLQARFRLDPRELALLDEKLRPFVPVGEYELLVGASSADIRLRGGFHLD